MDSRIIIRNNTDSRSYELGTSLLAALLAGAAAGTVLMFITVRYQWARWCEASSAPARTPAPPKSLQAR